MTYLIKLLLGFTGSSLAVAWSLSDPSWDDWAFWPMVSLAHYTQPSIILTNFIWQNNFFLPCSSFWSFLYSTDLAELRNFARSSLLHLVFLTLLGLSIVIGSSWITLYLPPHLTLLLINWSPSLHLPTPSSLYLSELISMFFFCRTVCIFLSIVNDIHHYHFFTEGKSEILQQLAWTLD